MKEILDQAVDHYDLVICDCPPGLSLLAESAIASADLIVVPQAPDRLSSMGLQLYSKYLKEDLEIADVAERTAVFINKMNVQTNVAQDYAKAIRREAKNSTFPYQVFDTEFKDIIAFKRAMEQPRQYSFSEIYTADIRPAVLAANRELWVKLGWIEK